MPVRTRSVFDRRADDSRYQELKQRLVAEWMEEAGAASPRPEITEETDAQGRVVHVYVAWDEWADLDAQTRSEMIVEALQQARGDQVVRDLTLAMGLTTAEASRLGR